VASWTKFDEITVYGSTLSQTYQLINMPAKQNYTGIIGVVPSTNQELMWGQVGFTYSCQGYAPHLLHNSSNLIIFEKNQQLQIPATGGTESQEW
jgi:hypothetical protein